MSDTSSFSIDEDYRKCRDTVAELCQGFPGAYWRELEDKPPSSSYPTAFVEALTKAGLLAVLIPKEYGGAGMPVRAGAVILETIHRSGCSAGACHAQMYTMGTLLRHGSEAQKSQYLPKIASGALRLQAFGVTEPTTGSDTTQLKTRAEKCDGGYLVNGQKVWISRAAHSDLMLLLARTTPANQVKRRTDGISVFLVDMIEAKKSGLRIVPIDAMVNHNTTEIFFDDIFLPDASLIGEEGRGFKYILDGMNAERCLVSAEAIGNGRYFIDKAIAHKQFHDGGRHDLQAIELMLADAFAKLEAADLMVRRATAMFDAGVSCGAEANMGKFCSGEAVWACAEACMTAFGTEGLRSDRDVERKWRDSRMSRNSPVSPNMILNFIGQHVLGLPRSY